jgi:hypothetical protein
MSNIEWLWTNGVEFDPVAQSVPEKLSKHGFAVMLNRMEEGKLQTAQLCIHDVFKDKGNPNVIIICPENLTRNWYYSLLWDMGVEFKYFGVYEKSLDLFSDTVSNFCIVSTEALSGKNTSGTALLDSAIVWDLMIIDLPLTGTADIQEYTKNIKTKAKKLLINTPACDTLGAKYEKLSAAAKALLSNGKKNAEYPLNLSETDGNVVAGRSMAGDYNVKTINYKIDSELIAKTERIDDTRSGIPLYSYGGNIFEEYNLAERSVYLGKEYDKKQLKALLAADAKLEAFLKEIVTLLSDSENRIVVYCTSPNTVNYVSKALWACNGGKKGICVYDSNATDAEFVRAEFDGIGSDEPNIIVADDKAGAKFLNAEKITHIINYEYPENPLVLEQRLTRSGRKAAANSPAFYIFCDEEYKFDGRMLRKTVLSNIGGAFSGVSDKSLLFDFENIEEHLIVLICELKFIADDAKDDIVESFRVEYNAPEVKTAKDASATAKKRLEKIVGIFGLSDVVKQGEVNDEKLFMQISEKVAKFKSKRVSLDGKGVLHVSDANKTQTPAKESPEMKGAAAFAKKLVGKKEDFELIKAEIDKLQDSQKLSVLISVWKYFKYELKIPKSYKEFMKLYNSIMKG